MMERKVSIPELLLIAGTRVALGVGIGLLIGERLSNDARRAAGIALAVVGGLTTIPLAMGIIHRTDDDSKIRSAA
jgi:hypothetical protein